MNLFVLLSALWTLASCCSGGGFNCTSGECVPAGDVCDFKEDCKDGSDEDFCGSCNFETHSCGWKDTSQHSYKWKWQMANFSSLGKDHTTGSSWGHVMHLEAQEGGFFHAASLEYSVNHSLALGCQISFWYYINNTDGSSITSSFLELNMLRGMAVKKTMISKSTTNHWEKATVFIGNQTPGYKLQILYSLGFGETKEVMLDDFSFENCAEGDIPEGSSNLTCNFEIDTCSWYHDYASSILWERSDGKFDDVSGNGYFMIIQTQIDLDPSATARLISFPQPAGQTICVSFFYFIFGNSIGSLKLISKQSGEPETVVWMRSGTQGNKWRFADLTFNSDKPMQFIIEAVVGGEQGSIAIDDIVMSVTGSCPPERECTFQGSLCGLQPEPTASFIWNRTTGMSLAANSSGPISDHTLGTDQGYYLSAELWKHAVGSRGAMMTAMMEPTPSSGECLMFWYYMEGAEVGELSVYLQTTGSSENATKLWARWGDQGTHWRHGRVTLLSPDALFQVFFEAVTGNGPKRDIAIDDLIVLNGPCPPTGYCDFEMDMCGWVNSPPNGTAVEWDWLSGESQAELLPNTDHTTNSALGHFAFLRCFGEKIAQLESETMEAVESACIEIWHHAEGFFQGLSDITLSMLVNENGALRRIFSTNGYMNRTWYRDRVDYSSSGPHKIILQASCNVSTTESLALDDVHIIRGRSCDDLLPTTTIPPTTSTSAPASPMDCSFEEGLCKWVQEGSDDMNWTLSRGLQEDEPWHGPSYDHTVGNSQGFFLVLSGSGSKDEEKSVVSVSFSAQESQSCVGFWYFMLGPSVSTLNLLLQTKSSELLMWTRHGTQNPEWIYAQVTISTKDTLKIMFSGLRSLHSEGFMAIDDVTVREGPCADQKMCGFDEGTCAFENSVQHKGRWERMRGTTQSVDHTYRTEHGFYMTVKAPNSTQSEVAELLSPKFSSAAEMCVRFWYQLPSGSSNTLSVHVLRSGELGDALWHRFGSPSAGWEMAEVTVSSPANFYVVFQASHVPGTNSTAKIDDFSVRGGACGPPGSCDFESGQCAWVNVQEENGHDWVLAHGGSYGPPTDHTTQTPAGWFLLSSAVHQSKPSAAKVVSEWIQTKASSCCLTFWYHMESSDSGNLRVFARSGPPEETLMFDIHGSGGTWSRVSQSVQISSPFQLLMEAQTNNKGFIAIDDISVKSGHCHVNETSSGFVGCSFENGTCGWEDISVGQFQWVRKRNSTGNTGPSVDNTSGTALGWYMAVEPERGVEMSPATLQSPIMTQASATCTLHFYYNMFGDDAELSVLLKENSRTTILWWLSGNHGGLWHHGEVMISRVPQDFTVLFQASRDFNNPGHVVIDDVSFTNCSLPEPQPSCPESMFLCKNTVCVEPSRICDYTDDCGDGSDENECENHGVVERCSFEQGLCSWAESELDTPGTEWTLRNAQDAWPHYGPSRDHTYNNAAGHYITPGNHQTAKNQTSEILSKTILPSINCTVRFFFFSLEDSACRLTVHFRTVASGIDDHVLWLRHTPESFSWQRAEVTFCSRATSKIVFRHEIGQTPRGVVALDDVSFSKECVFDPENSNLPDTPPTSHPPTTSSAPTSDSTAPVSPCQDNEFFCNHSPGTVCIPAAKQCDYLPDCPQAEDEAGCGSCTFERDQCLWTDRSSGQSIWKRLKSGNKTEPPSDHTTQTGFFMSANISRGSTQTEAKLMCPPLAPSSHYCQMMFHFHISTESTGSLRVLMQQADGDEAILWSRSHNTVSHWTPEYVPLGLLQPPNKIWFSSMSSPSRDVGAAGQHVVAVDDISFVNCEMSHQPPALPSFGCTFEESLCFWVQGAEDELDWLIGAGPTETPNTGPAGDHSTSKGKYVYIESSHPSLKGDKAQLKSSLLPPAGENGYCITFWYHMFGATVGSLKVLLKTAATREKTLVWQKSGNQGDEWLLAQSHVTLQQVHQVVLEASVGGEAGDIAIDDLSLISGPCPATDLCDFEEGSCNWQQDTNDDFDWIRQSGDTMKPNTGPDSDHTTNTDTGHYFYLPSSMADQAGQKAAMASPLYAASEGSCVELWYNMYGEGMGTLNVYQRSEDGAEALIFSQVGDQGRLWRFAQAALLPRAQPYRIVVEGVKAGPTLEGDMAFDDVRLTYAACPPHGFCDFEGSLCSWSNLGDGVDQGDWLLGMGASPNPNTGPTVDHTTGSSHGQYIYVDSSVGEWGDSSFLISDVFQPSSRGHCLTFWYHMYGSHVGTLRAFINDREMHAGGNEEGLLVWIQTGNKGDQWLQANVTIKHEEAFWFVFVYQRGMNTGGDIALDDITIIPSSCYSDPLTQPSHNNRTLPVGLSVGLILLGGLVICIVLFKLNRRQQFSGDSAFVDEEVTEHNSVFNMSSSSTDRAQQDSNSDFSFFNKLYDPAQNTTDCTATSTDA